jgi:hypothetical protein
MVNANQPKVGRSPLRAVPDAKEIVASQIHTVRRDAVEPQQRRPGKPVVRTVSWDEV